jgi:glycerophosphoryl diester phosphodiesterase
VSSSTSIGTSIIHAGRPVALKWHRLRRKRADPLFGADVLADGLRLGASMEIDLRVTADGDFVVLHDDVLDDETNGQGAVVGQTRAALAALRYDDAGVPGAPRHARPLVFLDELAALLTDAHPDALLQLDMKDDFGLVGQRGVNRFVDALERLASERPSPSPSPSPRTRGEGVLKGRAPTPTTPSPRPSRGEGKGEGPGEALEQGRLGETPPLIVSGDSSELILAIKQRMPQLAHGIEPSFRLIELFQKGDAQGAVALLRAELAEQPEPQMVYLNWQLILGALEKNIDLVAICRDAGKRVDAWTFTLADPAGGFSDREWRDFSQLLARGVDQISTDEAVATERAYAARMA